MLGWLAGVGCWIGAGCGPHAAEAPPGAQTHDSTPMTSSGSSTTGAGSSTGDESTAESDGSTSGNPAPSCGLAPLDVLFRTDGPHRVATVELGLVDRSRPTAANGTFEGSGSRELPTTVWYPVDGDDAAPLVMYSHALASGPDDGAHLAYQWASYGYVVAAPRFPLSHTAAPGGPTPADVLAQRDDIEFVIDQVVAASDDPASELTGLVDPDRVALTGLSLGALTSLLMLADPPPNVVAAVLFGTPACMLANDPFGSGSVATLAIHGDADLITPFEEHATALLAYAAPEFFVARLHGGTHTGFSALAQLAAPDFDNPDAFACTSTFDFAGLYPTVADAIDGDSTACTVPCTQPQPWPTTIGFSAQTRATAVLSLVYLDRVLRGCSDADALWTLLRNGGAGGVDVLPTR
jgi:dienelactone hydrolase